MLCFVDDQMPGIRRRRRGKGWQYFNADGARITDAQEIARLNRLGVPPAYRDVWLCPLAHGHLQATGIDEKGRKQYRYHDDFRAQQEADKYDRCVRFGQALPRLRAIVERDLEEGAGLSKTRIVAAVVRLLDVGRIRVGNEDYARANGSYGATTLRAKHGQVRGAKVKLEYRGKSGQMQSVVIEDRTLARLVRRCQDLPGQHLFQYLADDGEPHRIGSSEVNTYIRDAMGDEFTAKHFRTWAASVIAFETIVASDPDEGLTLKELLAPVAKALGNTPAISRKSYVHPLLIEQVREGATEAVAGMALPRATKYLSASERGLIAFLEAAEAPPSQAAA